MSKIAVIFPGIGYHKDKPLLYYAAKLALAGGYEIVDIDYHDLPQKIKGNQTMMKKAAELAYAQACEQLEKADLDSFDEVVFIGKSIGTVVSAKYLSEKSINARQIWYTPVEATFSFGAKDVVAFIGDADPWSDVDRVKVTAREQGIPLYSYADCNHSLECGSVDRNITILREVMKVSEEYLAKA